ncbi:hypothetical protein [Methylobacterium organophilum]|nr:hypothetical protein [Methylobacterium organophilum]
MSLHLKAARLRREAGDWAACAENYRALVEHHLGCRDTARAAAYAEKLVFVTERSSDPAYRMDVLLLAGTAYAEAGLVARAAGVAAKAAAVMATSRVAHGQERLSTLFGRIGEVAAAAPPTGRTAACRCRGTGRCIACQDGGDAKPAEFQVRIPLTPLDRNGSPRNSWQRAELSGIEMMMERPGPEGECLSWVGFRVEGGRHSIVTLPNWGGRAMRAARAMSAVSRADRAGTEGPSAAVLQVTCGLEAFINAVGYFLAQSGRLRWQDRFPSYVYKPDRRKFHYKSLHERWRVVGRGMFGPKWEGRRLHDLNRLVGLRHALVHVRGDEEQIFPVPSSPSRILAEFEDVAKPRAGPGPWPDRVLTPELAEWSVELGEGLIASFRDAWHALRWEYDDANLERNREEEEILVREADGGLAAG